MKYCTSVTIEEIQNLNINFLGLSGKEKIKYANIEAAFDTENTSIKTYNGEKVAFTYIWMFGLGLGNPVYYGRTYDELRDFINIISLALELTDEKRLPVYVHHLAYDFQFIRKEFSFTEVFSVKAKTPIRAFSTTGIEFRDSLILSGLSLAKTAENLTLPEHQNIKKLVDGLEYGKVRHHETILTEKELEYCKNDILVILAFIKEQMLFNKDIRKIPMTNTGYVRRHVRNECLFNNNNHKKSSSGKKSRYLEMMKNMLMTETDYNNLGCAFMGGFTHASIFHIDCKLKNVSSIDLTSSYPTVMVAEKFPMGSARREKGIRTVKELKHLAKTKCFIAEVEFINIQNELVYESYFSKSKCKTLENPTVINGRVFEADRLITIITDVDLETIEQVYSWDAVIIHKVYSFWKDYLPKEIIKSILDLYKDKTELKGVVGKEQEYLMKKGMLNSIYGMSVTAPVKDDHNYSDETGWWIDKTTFNSVNVKISSATILPGKPSFIHAPSIVKKISKGQIKLDEHNHDQKRVLFYAWGVWVTAYARRNLWQAIIEFGNDYVYSDTDSIKTLNYDSHKDWVKSYNDEITRKLTKTLNELDLDVSLLTPKTIRGIEKPMGVWEFEGLYSDFKTLGAKRYIYKEKDHWNLTVAGLSKQKGMDYIYRVCKGDTNKILDYFNDDMSIPADETGKLTHSYIDEEYEIQVTDLNGVTCRVLTLSGVHLEDCAFTLSLDDKMCAIIQEAIDGYTIYEDEFNL